MSRGQDATVALGSKVRAPAMLEFHVGRTTPVWDPPVPASFHTPQMRCLTMPMLLRALAQAQAARAGHASVRELKKKIKIKINLLVVATLPTEELVPVSPV